MIFNVYCCGENNIRDDTFILIAAATDTEKLCNRCFKFAVVFIRIFNKMIEIDNILHRPLTKSWLADDNATLVILNGSCNNF